MASLKRALLIFGLILSPIVAHCRPVFLDFTDRYVRDRVVARVNDKPLLNEKLTTEETNGVAKNLEIDVPGKSFILQVVLPRARVSLRTVISVRNGRFVAIRYSNRRLSIDQTRRQPMRD